MKHNEVTIEDLSKFIQEEDVTFANSPRENKRLACCLDGYLQVFHRNEIVWRGKRMDLAVDKYNSITEKWINPLKDFKI